MTDLRTFLAGLSIDPEELAAFIREPEAEMAAAGLDEAGRRALGRGSAAAMLDLLVGRAPAAGVEAPRAPEPAAAAPQGSLVVVGTGIRTVGQLTVEAIAWIKVSDTVLYVVADPVAEALIHHLNPGGAVSLHGCYGEGVPRSQSYEAMVQQIMGCVRAGQRTCAAFYGHPGVFAYPTHESVRRARQEGYPARMLPGISAEDCLFADLGVDPSVDGCQSFEATDFLLRGRRIDTASALVLWQVGIVGDWTYRSTGYDLKAFPALVSRLCALYDPGHEAFIYQAAMLPGVAPVITRITLGGLTPEHVTPGSTLYIPPARAARNEREMRPADRFVRPETAMRAPDGSHEDFEPVFRALAEDDRLLSASERTLLESVIQEIMRDDSAPAETNQRMAERIAGAVARVMVQRLRTDVGKGILKEIAGGHEPGPGPSAAPAGEETR